GPTGALGPPVSDEYESTFGWRRSDFQNRYTAWPTLIGLPDVHINEPSEMIYDTTTTIPIIVLTLETHYHRLLSRTTGVAGIRSAGTTSIDATGGADFRSCPGTYAK